MPNFLLSEKDRDIIQDAITRINNFVPASPGETASRIPQTPDILVAKATSTIPALTPDADTGTASNPEPGKGTAQVYQTIETVQDSPELFATESNTRTVYNLTSNTIATDKWLIIARDKYGFWYVIDVVNVSEIEFNRCTCNLTDDLAGEATTQVNNVQVIKGKNPTDSTTEFLLVYNPHGFSGDGNSDEETGTGTDNDSLDGALARIEWNETTERWEIYQLTCPA